jgi:hypothetical protein
VVVRRGYISVKELIENTTDVIGTSDVTATAGRESCASSAGTIIIFLEVDRSRYV